MFLNQPYPVSEKSPRQIVWLSLGCGLFIAVFLIVFQPYGTDSVDFAYKNFFLAGYGVLAALVIGGLMLVSANFADPAGWTVGKQILMMAAGVLLGITLSYFYLFLLGGSPSLYSYGVFVGNAMTVAVFPIVGITVADYIIKLKRYSEGAKQFNDRQPAEAGLAQAVEEEPGKVAMLEVLDEQERPVINLSLAAVWCIRSDRNYVDIVHLDGAAQPRKTTVRNTLTKVSADLPKHFLRSHRSYFVNAHLVESVTGNAQGYRLHSPRFPDFAVPVSRGKSTEILGLLRG